MLGFTGREGKGAKEMQVPMTFFLADSIIFWTDL